MPTREIVVNAGRGETRAAVLEDRRLVEVYIEREGNERIVGNIYKGRVQNVLPGMQAAFVDIGLERNAFLYLDDALAYHRVSGDEEEAVEPPRRVRNIDDVLRPGQEIVVQVAKEQIGAKGARVVTNLALPGRYLVLMPNVEYVGISRRIEDPAERERLKQVARRLRPRGMGLIVRTVAEGKAEEDLAQDCKFLVRLWDQIRKKTRRARPPALLYQDYDLVHRVVRDLFTPDVERFLIDSREEYYKTLETLDSLGPHLKSRVFLYTDKTPIFETYGIEPELEKALRRRVWLDCGGYLVIDETEALVSIDVNTGKFTGSTNLADTVLTTNLQAADEIARQLRLRDIGGIVIIDFIDMDSEDHRRRVLRRLEEAVRHDRTKIHIFGFTELGLVELTRKKVRQDLRATLTRPCSYCDGSGRVLSEETVAFRCEREIKKIAQQSGVEAILVELHPSVAALVIGAGGSNLRRLEEETGRTLFVRGNDSLHLEDIRVVEAGRREEVEQRAMPVREGEILDMEVEEPHLSKPNDGIARLAGYVVDIEGAGRMVGKRLRVEITKVYRTYAKGRMVSSS